MTAGKHWRQRITGVAFAIIAVLLAAPLVAAAPAGGADEQLNFAHSLYKSKLYGPAIPEYEKFLQANAQSPKAAEAACFLGHCYFRTRNWAKAVAAYRRCLDAKPADKLADEARMQLGQAFFELGQYDKASATYTEQLGKTKDRKVLAQAHYWLAEAEFSRKRIPEAETNYRAVAEKYPESDLVAYAYYSLGVCAGERGDPQAAIAALDVVRQRYQKFEAMEEVLVRLGDAYRALKKFAEARQAYAGVVDGDPNSELRPAALLGSAYCALDQKEYPAALTAAEEAAKLAQPNTRERREASLVASNARYGLKKYAEALQGYQNVAVGEDADLAEQALYWAGNALRAQGKHLEAAAQYQQLIERYPKGVFAAKAQLRIGDCYASAGKPVEAATAYKAVLEHYAGSDAEKEARTGLDDVAAAAAGGGDPNDLRRLAGVLPAGLAGSVLVQIANKEFAAGHYQQAADEATKVLAGSPPAEVAEQAQYLLGASRFQLNDSQNAAEAYNLVITRYPQGKLVNQAYLELAWCYLDLKKHAEAAKTAKDLLARNPEGDQRVSALLALADASLAAGTLKDAEDACEKALAANPKPEDALTALYDSALVAHREKRFEDAVARWGKVLEKSRPIANSPVTGRACYYLGYALSQLKRYPEANASLEQAAAAGGEMAEQSRYELAWNLIETKENDRAAAEFERVATDFPKGALAAKALFLAGEQYFAKKDYPGALQRYRAAEALKPEGELAYDVAMRLGAALYATPDYPAAAAAFARASGLMAGGKDAAEALYWAGDAYARANDAAQAGTYFDRYLEKAAQGEFAAAACLGSANAALAKNDAARAAALCERGLPTAQGDVATELQVRLGDALRKQGKLPEAARAYLKVAIGNADSDWAPQAQFLAGQTYEQAGDNATAAEVYRALVERYPQSKSAEQAKARLTALGQK